METFLLLILLGITTCWPYGFADGKNGTNIFHQSCHGTHPLEDLIYVYLDGKRDIEDRLGNEGGIIRIYMASWVWIALVCFCLVSMLYHLLDCNVTPRFGSQWYIYVWLPCYTYIWFSSLYLFLIIPTSVVMVTSAFYNFDFRPVLSTSGFQFYTYIYYIQFWFVKFYHLLRPLEYLS